MEGIGYTARLEARSGAMWKRLIGAQIPYRNHIRRIADGNVLDIGCGIGRNLEHLGGRGVGVDLNPHSVEAARRRGLEAYLADEFDSSSRATPAGYRTLLFAHVVEHMDIDEAKDLVNHYLSYLEPGGRVIVIVPQQAGFESDETHVSPIGPSELSDIANANELIVERVYSFPFPAWVGRFFTHNETVALMRKTGAGV